MKELTSNKVKQKKAKYTIIGLLLVAVSSLIVFASNPSYAIDLETYDVGGNGVGQLTIGWLEGDQAVAGRIDENGVLQISPIQNNIYDAFSNTGGGVHASYQLTFNMGGSQDAAPKTVKIRIPKYIFYGRDGLPIADQVIDIPLVEAPAEEGTGFNYRFEAGSDGKEYIVLENFATLPPSYSFVASFTWILKDPSTVANGFTRKIKGTVELDLDKNGTTDINSTSNEIEMKYNTDAKINTVTKDSTTHRDKKIATSTNVYLEWQDKWDNTLKPANADNYVYAITYATAQVQYATQPYKLTFYDTPTDGLGGEVIGYCRAVSSINSSEETGDGGDYCFRPGQSQQTSPDTNISSGLAHTPKNVPLYAEVKSPSSSTDNYSYYYFLTKYPKSKLLDGKTHDLKDTVTVKLETPDGNTDEKTADYSKTYRYTYIEPQIKEEYLGFLPSKIILNAKGGSRTVNGAINILETTKNGHTIELGHPPRPGPYTSDNYNYIFGGNVEDYALTMREGGNASNPEDYGQTTWTANFVDETMIYGNSTSGYEVLNAGDYEITSFGFYVYRVYDYISTTTESFSSATNTITRKIGFQNIEVSIEDSPPIKVYYKTDGDDWIYYGSAQYDSKNYYFTTVDGETLQCKDGYYADSVPLPSGVTAIKASVESKLGRIELRMVTYARLTNSERIRSIIASKDEVQLYNFSTAYSEDIKGNTYGTFEGDVYNSIHYKALNNDFEDLINEIDMKKYGKIMGHGYDGDTHTRLEGGTTHQNKWVAYEQDAANRRIKANYVAYATEVLEFDDEAADGKTLLDMKVVNEQRSGTFYDLLPLGMTVDIDTIQVQTFNTSSAALNADSNMALEGDAIPFTYSFIENWQNSGRTMLIVKALVPDEMNNYLVVKREKSSSSTGNFNDSTLYTGMTLRFTGLYNWDSFIDYGTTLTNTVAYKSGSGALSNGYKDNASSATGIALKELMNDLDQDGNPKETTIADTVYAQRQMIATFNIASDTSFTKGVKTANLPNYVDGQDGSVVVAGGGYYTYRLRFASQRNTSTTNLVIYDVLEDFDDGEHESWKGILRNVDVSQMEDKGIDVKVYYSTKNNIDLYVNGKATIDLPPPPDADLNDQTIWSLEPPKNMADVTAIAIDCSKNTNGEAYALEQEDSVVALLTMQAPVTNISTLVTKNAKALNVSWWRGTTQQLNQMTHNNFSVFEWTQVGIKNIDLDIDKESYIPSGTKDNPAIVEKNDMITYDIIIKNTSDWAALKDVKVRDILPKEVKPVLGGISYYIEGEGSFEDSTLVSNSGIIKMTANGQILDFTINQLLSEDVFHILIPTTVKTQSLDIIENTASIVGANDMEFEIKSPTTYHKTTSPELGSITIKKKVVDGDKQKQFKFKITLINSNNKESDDEEDEVYIDPLNTTYNGIEFTDGVAYIYLSDKQSITITNIPSGIQYTVEEDDYSKEGYITSIKNSSGTITKSTNIEVEVTNTYIENPDTGVGFKFVIILMILGITIFATLRKHKSRIFRV